MQTLKVKFSPTAITELAAIFEYVLEISKSVSVAAGFTRRIKERCDRIGNIPHGGRPRDDLALGLRTVPFEKSVVIAYVVTADAVEISNIFYGGRDYEALYRNHIPTDPDA